MGNVSQALYNYGPRTNHIPPHIVATGTLCIKHTLEFTIADIESVVVSSRCRGRGYGKELMLAMVYAAKSYETNCYKMMLA